MIVALAAAAVCVGLLYLGAPYVPTHKSDLENTFECLGPGEGRVFVDLGSGSGRVLIAAANRGYKAIGYEINPILWLISKLHVNNAATIYFKPWQASDFSQAEVIYLFSTSWHLRHLDRALFPDSAIIVVYGPQPQHWNQDHVEHCGSATLYLPVA